MSVPAVVRALAMVSVMTFEAIVEHYELYLAKVEPEAVEEARARLAEFLADAGGDSGGDAMIFRCGPAAPRLSGRVVNQEER